MNKPKLSKKKLESISNNKSFNHLKSNLKQKYYVVKQLKTIEVVLLTITSFVSELFCL